MARFYYRCGLAVLLACLAAAPAMAQKSVHHLERCTRWGYIDAKGMFGTSNTCKQAVEIEFMTQGHPHAVVRVLKPGEVFDSGFTRAQIQAGWWMFTTCPAGYASSVAFTPDHRDVLIPSKYRCIAKAK